MRKGFISAVIGGLMLPIAGTCAAVDAAAIRNIALVYGAFSDGPGRRKPSDRLTERRESLAARASRPADATELLAEAAACVPDSERAPESLQPLVRHPSIQNVTDRPLGETSEIRRAG